MTIPRECKRLAEVDFPIAVVSKHAVREKSIRHGHPSTLHLWWARRPLASSRAMLLALLLPDPCDPHCPPEFNTRAREALGKVQNVGPSDADLQRGLLKFIGDFANWDLAWNRAYLEAGRALVRAAYDDQPLVVDPFAGGGSIPLEALRLGCDAFGSDLNPVAGFMLKIELEDIPRSGDTLTEELRNEAESLRSRAEAEIRPFYPEESGGRPLAYFWARSIRCDAPDCGAEIPLATTFWLSKRKSHRRALQPRVTGSGSEAKIEFDIVKPERDSDVRVGTVQNGKATCLVCNMTVVPKRLQALMTEQPKPLDVVFDDGGTRLGGARLLAVYVEPSADGKREYRLPTDADYAAVRQAQQRADELDSSFPHEEINDVRPSPNARGLSAVTRYGARTFDQLFSARQKLSLDCLRRELESAWQAGDEGCRRRVEILSAALGKRADYSSGGTRWHLTFEKATCTFSKQALAQAWDFVEPTAIGKASGSYGAGIDTVLNAVKTLASVPYGSGQSAVGDARDCPLPADSASVWFTDPPYYDAIPYADLSDFFYVWLKRALPSSQILSAAFDPSTGLTPKLAECVWNQTYEVDGRAKDGLFFENCVAAAFSEGRRVLSPDGIGSVVFAHKTTEGWEALLSGLIEGGWVVTTSWPIATERVGRLQSQNSAALATSVHLVCRPRGETSVGDWADVLRALPERVSGWMQRLQGEGVRGADLVFACIGPALEIYSRFERVETADGRGVPLAEYLEKVWEVVGRAALTQILGSEGDTGALEEDARLVALFLWTLQSTAGQNGAKDEAADDSDEEDATPIDDDDEEEPASSRKAKGYTLIYDVVRRFAQPLGIHLEDWERRIIETKKGTVRLLPVTERAKQLFGEDGAHAAADQLETPGVSPQLSLFPEVQAVVKPKRGKKIVVTAGDDVLAERRGATTLDRLHAALLLQASGRSNALRSLLAAEVDRGPEFLRLANSLSALYPRDSEEKRLIDAMLLAAPR